MSGKTIGHVTELTGSAEIRTPDGSIKLVAAGDSVADGDLLITGSATQVKIDFLSGKKLEVGEDTEILFDETVYRAEAFADADVMADVLALQQALLEGVEDLAELESTAAGPEQQVGSSANLSQTPLYTRDGREGNVDSRQEFMDPGAVDPIDGDRDDLDAASTATTTSGGNTASEFTAAADTPASISGTFAGGVAEGNLGDAPVTATGTITISDSDPGHNPTFADITSAGDNGFGSFVLAGGVWTYTLDQSAVQDLDAGDVVNDTVTFTTSDGSTQQVTVTITGTDDASVISGAFTGAVTEGDLGDTATATGTLAISDVDADDSPTFPDATSAGGNGFGNFALVGGVWTYTLDQSAVQDLDAGDIVNDTITFTASDGSTQQITVTITGTDDASVISGTFTGAVTEGDIGDVATATGTLAISDADADDSPTFPDAASAGDNGFGNFDLVGGAWTYTLDQSAVQDLDAGDIVNDTVTFTASDGSTQQVTVTITGTDDASVISGTFTGAVTEGDIGDTATATGTLVISDVDADDSPTFPDAASAGDNGFGNFALVGGAWTYTLDQTAVQDLDAGDVVNDTFTFAASDGSTQQVTVTITGADDASVISGTFTGAVTEGDIGDTATATGSLSISDVDADDSPTFPDATSAGDNGFGNFVLVGGVWTYTLDQSAVQDLDAGDVANDTVTFTASDGSTQQVTVTITGTDDASVISGAFTERSPRVTLVTLLPRPERFPSAMWMRTTHRPSPTPPVPAITASATLRSSVAFGPTPSTN